MESPKLLWLKENSPSTWARAAHFFDLPDFPRHGRHGPLVVFTGLQVDVTRPRASGNQRRRWSRSYWEAIGLWDLVQENFKRIGTRVRPIGASVGNGLSERAAREFVLPVGTSAGTSMIDARAGAHWCSWWAADRRGSVGADKGAPCRTGFSWQPLAARGADSVRHDLGTEALCWVGGFGAALSGDDPGRCLRHPPHYRIP